VRCVGSLCVSRALRGGRGKEEPLSAIAMALQAAPGNDDLPPRGPPQHTSAAQCLTTRTHEASPCAGYPALSAANRHKFENFYDSIEIGAYWLYA